MLHYETVTSYLRNTLMRLMTDASFDKFRLVGGTSLSLRLGHRMSIDIDLFSNAEYGDIDFFSLQSHLRAMFPYCVGDCGRVPGMGASYFVGNSRDDAVKLDLFYTDEFIGNMVIMDGIRLASLEDIIAMKLDVVARGGRKKDFWDIHELCKAYSPMLMMDYYERRYPYGYSREEMLQGFSNYEKADTEPDPNCLLHKDWETIKRDLSAYFLSGKELRL